MLKICMNKNKNFQLIDEQQTWIGELSFFSLVFYVLLSSFLLGGNISMNLEILFFLWGIFLCHFPNKEKKIIRNNSNSFCFKYHHKLLSCRAIVQHENDGVKCTMFIFSLISISFSFLCQNNEMKFFFLPLCYVVSQVTLCDENVKRCKCTHLNVFENGYG